MSSRYQILVGIYELDVDDLLGINNPSEKRLLYEVLIRGICDALKFIDDPKGTHLEYREHKDGYKWIRSNKKSEWSFLWICEQISTKNPKRLIKAIREMIRKCEETGEVRNIYEKLTGRGFGKSRRGK